MKNPLARLRPTEAPVVENHVSPEKTATDKEANVISNTSNTSADGERDSDEVSLDAQAGVQNVEAMTKTWSRSHLILAYVT
jgi:hypothetical protein